MTCECVESPIDEIYRIRQEISAQYDHDPYKLYCAVLEDQRERARQGQVYWGYNAAGELAPLSAKLGLIRKIISVEREREHHGSDFPTTPQNGER